MLATKRGGVRPARLNTFALPKDNGGMGETSTATLVYLPEYASRTMGAERIHVDLGNNGRLRVSPPKKDVTTVENPSTSINGQTVTVGSVLRYEVSWTNTASTVANDVSITDVAPAGTQYVLGEDGQPVTTGEVVVLPNAGSDPVDATPALRGITATLGDDGILTWNAGDVQPGETVQVSFQVRVTSESVTTVDNQASLAVGPNTYDTNWVHNPVPVKDVSFAEEPTTSINGQTVRVGDTVRYQVEWTNATEVDAVNVVIVDAAPAGTEYAAATVEGALAGNPEGSVYDADGTPVPDSVSVAAGTATAEDGSTVETRVWTAPLVKAGQTVRVSFQVRVSGESVSVVDNQATMTVGRNDHSTNWVHNPVEVLEGSDTVTLQLEKTLRGRPMEEGEFGFVATDTATGEQMTALAPAAPDGVAASVTFKPIVYTSGSSMEGAELQPDGSLVKRFVCAISEVNGGVDGVLYDPATFYAVVNVTDDQRGTVTAEGPVYCYDADGAQPIEGLPSYINRYSDGLPFVPGAYKTTEATEGHDPSGLSFGFAVTDNNGGANQGQIVATGTAPANGPVTFSTMEFFEPGTYDYVIRELRGGAGGSLTYDGASFGLQVVHQEPARRPGQRPGADPRRVRLCDHRRRHR